MHLEDQYKEVNKGHNQKTANQSIAQNYAASMLQTSLVQTLKNDTNQCAASPQLIRMHKSSIGTEFRTFSMEIYTPQNCLPTSWASNLERENSGFSV